jgi:hypothetical protein
MDQAANVAETKKDRYCSVISSVERLVSISDLREARSNGRTFVTELGQVD